VAPSQGDDDSGATTRMALTIAGAAIVGLIVVALVTLATLCYCSRRKRAKDNTNAKDDARDAATRMHTRPLAAAEAPSRSQYVNHAALSTQHSGIYDTLANDEV